MYLSGEDVALLGERLELHQVGPGMG